MQASYRRCYGFAMKRLAFVLVVVAACSSGQKKTSSAGGGAGSGSGSGSGGPALYAKKVGLGWGFQRPSSTSTDVFLEATDETGKQTSYPLGTFAGECKRTTPGAEMKALIGAACTTGGSGIELHVVVQDQNIIVLKLRTDPGVKPDPMAREEITRVKAPGGAAIEATP
jgi:hypothetical protein